MGRVWELCDTIVFLLACLLALLDRLWNSILFTFHLLFKFYFLFPVHVYMFDVYVCLILSCQVTRYGIACGDGTEWNGMEWEPCFTRWVGLDWDWMGKPQLCMDRSGCIILLAGLPRV